MVAVVDRHGSVAIPRTRFSALVAGSDPDRRAQLVGRLRSLGAAAVIEAGSPTEARARSRMTATQDVCVIDSTDRTLVAAALLADLGRAGWRRVVMVDGTDPVVGARAALGRGVRGYVVLPPSGGSPVTAPRVRSRGGAPDELSLREIEVLEHVSHGRSNKDIGDVLGLSALTVKSHLARIGRKLGTGDRAEMVAQAFRSGLLR